MKGILFILVVGAAIFAYVKFHDKFGSKDYDERGFKVVKNGTYGTATWMSEKEMQEELEVTTPEKAEGTILGEYKGKIVCMPKDTRLNRDQNAVCQLRHILHTVRYQDDGILPLLMVCHDLPH